MYAFARKSCLFPRIKAAYPVLIGLLIFLGGESRAQPAQSEFMIGSWFDPEVPADDATFDARLRRFRDAGFNLLTGTTVDLSRATTLRKLSRIAAVNNASPTAPRLRMMVTDRRIWNHQCNDPYDQQVVTDVENTFDLTNDPQGAPLTADQRGAMLGYHLCDEPAIPADRNPVIALNWQGGMQASDPTMHSWVGLLPHNLNNLTDYET
jgi:hypothetical protein